MVTIFIKMTRRKLWSIFKNILCHFTNNIEQMFFIFSEDRVACSGLILFKGISILYILDFYLIISCWVLESINEGNYMISFLVGCEILFTLSPFLYQSVSLILLLNIFKEFCWNRHYWGLVYGMWSSLWRNSFIIQFPWDQIRYGSIHALGECAVSPCSAPPCPIELYY